MTKYLSKINKGGHTLVIKDSEAREAIGIDTSVEIVDLGLPSGTLWAKCNIGATEETDYGNYYGYSAGEMAVRALGETWQMPTKTQCEELIANTNYSWVTNFNNSGINGGKFACKTDATKYIFIPASGVGESGQGSSGWIRTSTEGGSKHYSMYIINGTPGVTNSAYGDNDNLNVRPVCETAPLNKLSDKADKKDTYTKTEVDDKLQTKSDISHNHDLSYTHIGHVHDDRYYTESEADAAFATKEEQSQAVASLSDSIADASLYPVDVSALTPSTTFRKGSVIGINGVLYRAESNTTYLPFTLVVQDGVFVTVEVGGIDVFIIADPTLNLPWKPWTDASVQAHLTDLDIRMAALETANFDNRIKAIESTNSYLLQKMALHESRIAAVEAKTQSVTYNGHTYTLQQIMAQVAKLMDATVIIEQPEE